MVLPNLEQCALLEIDYKNLQENCSIVEFQHTEGTPHICPQYRTIHYGYLY